MGAGYECMFVYQPNSLRLHHVAADEQREADSGSSVPQSLAYSL